jgi:asparagine synthase (glutamine-hydrolysing)
MAAPWEEKFRPGEMKSLLFRAMKGILPETVRTRRQNASTGHAVYLGLRKEWPQIERMTRKTILSELGIVNAEKFREALLLARCGHAADLQVLLSTLALEAWLQSKLNARKAPDRISNPRADYSFSICGSGEIY